jgi:uncharacterized protein (TIGR02265 family)
MFVEPDWSKPVDFQARLAAIPKQATVRGMFMQFLLESMEVDITKKIGVRRYLAFKSYPMREYVELLALGCELGFPGVPAAEAVRRLGRRFYPKYAQTITGTAIFAVAGRSFQRVVELTPAAYRVAVSPGTITVRSVSEQHARVELRDIWNLPDLHQVGIWEGAMLVCGAEGTIKTERIGMSAADFDINWVNT